MADFHSCWQPALLTAAGVYGKKAGGKQIDDCPLFIDRKWNSGPGTFGFGAPREQAIKPGEVVREVMVTV
jgi:hypothetical protein